MHTIAVGRRFVVLRAAAGAAIADFVCFRCFVGSLVLVIDNAIPGFPPCTHYGGARYVHTIAAGIQKRKENPPEKEKNQRRGVLDVEVVPFRVSPEML